MDVNDDRYTGHRVFAELTRFADFYDALAFSISGVGSTGTTAVYNFNSRFYSSMQGTVESFRDVLRSGRINDAYALLRKYHDSAVINVYSNLYAQEQFSIDNLVVAQINDWLKGIGELPRYGVMSSYIRSSDTVEPINRLLYSDGRYKQVRERCNSHMHYNLFANAILNDKEVHLEARIQLLDAFLTDAEDLFVLHIAYTFFLNEHYMSSSDYVDALELGIKPEPDSQYWVAPFVQTIFDEVIAKRRSDIVAVIKEHTCMELV